MTIKVTNLHIYTQLQQLLKKEALILKEGNEGYRESERREQKGDMM